MAMQMHDSTGDTEDLAREAFGQIDIPLGGHGFDAAMLQVRFAQIVGAMMACEKRLETTPQKAQMRNLLNEACLEVGFLREDEVELFYPHALLYERVLEGLGSGDDERNRALLGIQFADFLVADRNPALVSFGTALFQQSEDGVEALVEKRKIV